MMEMEPFPFFQDDAAAMAAATTTAAAMEDLLSWDFCPPRALPDLVSPFYQPPPLPSEEDVLPWLTPLSEEQATSLPVPQPPAGAQVGHSDWSPMTQSAAVPDQPWRLPPTAAAPGLPRSAFVRYERSGQCGQLLETRAGGGGGGGEGRSIHRRVIEYLRKMPVERAEKRKAESSRCFRHMMRERQRRERLSQSYADLHSMIAPRPKADKNSIVRSAAAYIGELKGTQESLQRRHQELRESLGEGGERPEGAMIKLRVGNPSSPVDSMIAALRRLKSMDVKARSIRSCAAGVRELSAVIDVETKMSTKEVEKAVQGALVEVEWKLRTGSGRAHVGPPSTQPRGRWSPGGHVASCGSPPFV